MSLRPLFCIFLSGRFTQVLLYMRSTSYLQCVFLCFCVFILCSNQQLRFSAMILASLTFVEIHGGNFIENTTENGLKHLYYISIPGSMCIVQIRGGVR